MLFLHEEYLKAKIMQIDLLSSAAHKILCICNIMKRIVLQKTNLIRWYTQNSCSAKIAPFWGNKHSFSTRILCVDSTLFAQCWYTHKNLWDVVLNSVHHHFPVHFQFLHYFQLAVPQENRICRVFQAQKGFLYRIGMIYLLSEIDIVL